APADFREQFHAVWGVGDAPAPMGPAEAAAARIAPLFEVPSTIGPTEPLASLPTGARLGYVGIGTANEDATGIEFLAAADLLGFDVTVFAAGFDAASQIGILEEMATQNFDVVVMQSYTEAAATSPQMKAVKDSGAIVVSYGTALPGRQNELMDHQFLAQEDSQQWGTLIADWVVADSGGNAKVLATYAADFAAGNAQHEGFVGHLEATCPGCEVVGMDFNLAELGTELPGRIVSAMQADSEIDYVLAGFGAVFIGVPEALDEAGLLDQAKGIGWYGTAFNQQLIVDGRFQVVSQNVGNPYRGYLLADAAARLLAGQEIEDWSDLFYEPLQFSTADNIDDPTVDCLCAPPDFREQFHALWGVG
ncbi:MAG: sugar ABC transporter substrate-binding protein, partial [Acidimicrobiia bacterium]|nr:sugar ABC transporter substrate-binding protein [Acidimicrobiia bacterium]